MNIAKRILYYSFYGVLLAAMGLAAINAFDAAFTIQGNSIWYQIFCFFFNALAIIAGLVLGIQGIRKDGNSESDNRKLNHGNSIIVVYLLFVLISYFVYTLLLISMGQNLPISMMLTILLSAVGLIYSLLVDFQDRPLAKCIGSGIGYFLFLAFAIVELRIRILASGLSSLVGYLLILLALVGLGMNIVSTVEAMLERKEDPAAIEEEPSGEERE